MSDLLAPFATLLADLVTALANSIFDPRAWLSLFLAFILGYGRYLWRWWVPLLALAVAIAIYAAISTFAPSWKLPPQPVSVASTLATIGILVIGFLAGKWIGGCRR
jgi:hypothetical protein